MDARPLTGQAGNRFDCELARRNLPRPVRGRVTTLQVNLGKYCNQSCRHCHVQAGPDRTEQMTPAVAQKVIRLLEASPDVTTVDLTGGAPELYDVFRDLVKEARLLGRRVTDRCNLTVCFVPGQEDLAEFLRDHQVEVIASLPCYTRENVDRQRGPGVFNQSVRALQRLNSLGYGAPGSPLKLHLVYNPLRAFLPSPQEELGQDYRRELGRRSGIRFNRLFVFTNMPINRFADYLYERGEYSTYLELLAANFNENTVEGLMCRSLVSVSWDGKLYDCDFNQMLGLSLSVDGEPATLDSILSLNALEGLPIATGAHCLGCTAGCGSSCTGALIAR